jgi:hypothetical protein
MNGRTGEKYLKKTCKKQGKTQDIMLLPALRYARICVKHGVFEKLNTMIIVRNTNFFGIFFVLRGKKSYFCTKITETKAVPTVNLGHGISRFIQRMNNLIEIITHRFERIRNFNRATSPNPNHLTPSPSPVGRS